MNLLREPLLHFVVAGTVLFGGYELIRRGGADAARPEPIHISEGEINWLTETFASQWRRPASVDELNGLVHGLVEEELLAREALALGLDQNDTIVRRRLAQKLTFLIDDTARIVEPAEDELRRFYAANAERFRTGARVSFSQVFFNPERRQHADSDARAALISISATSGHADAASIGDPLLVESEFKDADRQLVSNLFGAEFAEAVFALKSGLWSGPIKSGYGLHLVRVSEVSQGEPKPFEEVRSKVLEEWQSQEGRAAKVAYLAKLQEKYGVIIDDNVKPLLRAEDGKAK